MNDVTAQQFLDRVVKFEQGDRRRMTIATIIAIVVWLLVATTSMTIVSRARTQLAEVRDQKERLGRQTAQLRDKLLDITAATAELESKNAALQRENARLDALVNGPLSEVITPKMTMRRNPNLTFRGLPLYDIIFYIDLPFSRRGEIASVRYEIDHPTKIEKSMEGKIPGTGFAVSYRGYACFARVQVKVIPLKGKPFIISYNNMCSDWVAANQ